MKTIKFMRLFSRLRPAILVCLFFSLMLGTILLGGVPLNALTPPPPISGLSLTQGVRQTVLDNGLTVLTKEVHTAPVVSVQVWYRVGSRNEKPGINGLSHQLEHLMFKGTTDRPVQFGRLFSALGGDFNAFTSYDETAYHETAQPNELKALLTLEADRMQNALLGPQQLSSEKKVVISELEGYENSPAYRLNKAVMRAALPDRMYGFPVGGTASDVEKFTPEEVQNYYKTYYSPDNATLVIVGDFETNSVLQDVQQTFSKVPKRNQQRPHIGNTSNNTVTSDSKTPIVLKQPGSAALLEAVYPLPDVNNPDVPAIDIMDAILTGGRSSRLYQSLIETGLASSVDTSPNELIEPGWYDLSATAAPGQDIQKIDQVLQQELTKIQTAPVSMEELNRAKTQLQASFVLGNEDITSQANQLGYNQTVAGDYHYVERYMAAIAKLTPADILRVAKIYLNPAKQTIGYFEPTQNTKNGNSNAGSSRTVENFSPGKPVDPAELAKYLPPVSRNTTTSTQAIPQQFTLANGMQVLFIADHSVPAVNLDGYVNAGSEFDTDKKAGLASLVAANLMNGTKTKNALAIAKTLEDRGVSLGFGASREGVNLSGVGLSADLPVLVQTLADVMQNATFPADELQVSRQRALAGLKAQLDSPAGLAIRTFQKTIYPENHPFHSFPTQQSLEGITRADAINFYQQHYRPDTTKLVLVGDFDQAKVKDLLNQAFGEWHAQGKPPVLEVPKIGLPKTTTYLSQVIPGKTESVTFIGYRGISRKDPRYYAALLLNHVLGGSTLSSRLGTEVRDRLGLTYGIYSGFAAGINPGPFLIQMQTSPQDAQKAVNATVALLKQFQQTGITAAELEAAKRSIISNYPVGLASPSDVSATILSNAMYGLNPAEIREFPQQIQAVTLNQVQQVIKELIHPNHLVIVTAGPGQTSAQQ